MQDDTLDVCLASLADLQHSVKFSDIPVLAVFIHKDSPFTEQIRPFRKLYARYNTLIRMFLLSGGSFDAHGVTYNITRYPTYIFFVRGKEVKRFTGEVPTLLFEDFIQIELLAAK